MRFFLRASGEDENIIHECLISFKFKSEYPLQHHHVIFNEDRTYEKQDILGQILILIKVIGLFDPFVVILFHRDGLEHISSSSRSVSSVTACSIRLALP